MWKPRLWEVNQLSKVIIRINSLPTVKSRWADCKTHILKNPAILQHLVHVLLTCSTLNMTSLVWEENFHRTVNTELEAEQWCQSDNPISESSHRTLMVVMSCLVLVANCLSSTCIFVLSSLLRKEKRRVLLLKLLTNSCQKFIWLYLSHNRIRAVIKAGFDEVVITEENLWFGDGAVDNSRSNWNLPYSSCLEASGISIYTEHLVSKDGMPCSMPGARRVYTHTHDGTLRHERKQ